MAGAGPVGLVTALLLGRHGVAVDVVDRGSGPVGESRATDLHPATLEGLAPYGVTQDLLGIGTRVRRVQVSAGGRRVGSIRLGRSGSPYPFALTVPQCTTEGLLQEHLAELGVAVRRQTRLVGLATRPDGVDVAVEANGRPGTRRTTGWSAATERAARYARQRASAGPGCRGGTRVAPAVGTRTYERVVAAWLAGGW